MSTTLQGENCLRVSVRLLSYAPLASPSGFLALQLRGADDTQIEVSADAALTLQQLAGSAEAALGQTLELSLDVFGFPELRVFTPGAPSGSSSTVSPSDPCLVPRPHGRR